MAVRSLFSQEGGLKGGSSGVLTQYFDVDLSPTDASGGVIELAPMTGTMVIKEVNIYTPAAGIAGATDVDLGFYKSKLHGSTELDKDIIGDGLDLSGAEATVDGITFLNVNRNKDIRTLVAADPSQTEYVFAMTANSAVTGSGVLKVEVVYFTNS